MRKSKMQIRTILLSVGLMFMITGLNYTQYNPADLSAKSLANQKPETPVPRTSSLTIQIAEPRSVETFGTNPPYFDVQASLDIWDMPWNYVSSLYYILNNDISTLTLIGANGGQYLRKVGYIDQSQWNNIPPGTVALEFIATDANGVYGQVTAGVYIQKSIPAPQISINSPQTGQLCNVTAPTFSLSVSNYAAINASWYSLDSGVTKTFCNLTGDFSAQWGNASNGTVTATFYVQDIWGQVGSASIILQKDVVAPVITGTGLTPNQLCGATAPSFVLTVANSGNLASTWYSLDNGTTNTNCNLTGDLSTQWSACGNGTVPVTFWARDILGNTTFTTLILRKDVIAPAITSTGLVPNQAYGTAVPFFSLEVANGGNLAATWYSLDSGLTNTTCGLTGDFSAQWASAPNGPVIATFWIQDILGNATSTSVTIQKQAISTGILVNAADMACGFGSDRYGVALSVDVTASQTWTVHAAIEEMRDLNGDNLTNALYSNVSSAVVTGLANVTLSLSILYCEAGRVGDGQSGTFYRYHIWANTQNGSITAEQYIDNVSLNFWSNWDGANVTWDAIPQYNAAGYNVYIKMAYWNQSTGLLYDGVYANGTVITTSGYIGQQPAAGEMSLPLPTMGTMSSTGVDMSAFMSLYGTGWYYFTYVAQSYAADPWVERLGCPPIPS